MTSHHVYINNVLFNKLYIRSENEPGVIAANVKEFTALESIGLKKL